jgi:hypothetical protein
VVSPAVAVAPARSLRFLAGTLVAGGLYDLVFAALFLIAPGLVGRTFDLPLPGPPFYLPLLAILLAIVGAMNLVAARDPGGATGRALVAVAIAGRLAGALALGTVAARHPELAGLWPTAVGDFAFAALHAAGARPLLAGRGGGGR